MKTLICFMTLISLNAFASNFTCKDISGDNKALLSVTSKNQIFWNEPWHSADSKGEFLGIEKAPYSEWKGYRIFQLTSFYTTNDSSYRIALNKMSGNKIKAFMYFDNDDHVEEVTEYICE